MSTGLIDIETLEKEVNDCKGLIAASPEGVKHAIAVAKAIGVAKKYVRAMMPHLIELQGSTLGFQTDKLYSEQELVNPLTEAGILIETSSGPRSRVWRSPEVLAALDAFAERAGRRDRSEP